MLAAYGLGCMRLPSGPEGVAVVHRALSVGATLLDTADVYYGDGGAVGDNERLVAEALASWSGDRESVVVATKGGLTRPRKTGRWKPVGTGKHLRAACEASLERLGRIDLYQLHAPDPRTKWSTSLRALQKLKEVGLVGAIGVCNVTHGQLTEALERCDLASVQVAVSPLSDTAVRGGVVELCREHDVEVIAHSPLGGHPKRELRRLRKHAVVRKLSHELGVPAESLLLAWLVSHGLVPIPGASTPDHVVDGLPLLLPDVVEALDAAFPGVGQLRRPRAERAPSGLPEDGEVVLVMGLPGAGKSTAVVPLVEAGYTRLNRDLVGGRLRDLLPRLDALLTNGVRRVVLDNTYVTRALRNEVVEVAWRHGVPVRCIWIDTSIEDAQFNAVQRMVATHGRLLEPKEMARADANDFGPDVQYRFKRQLEPPTMSEGFWRIDRRPFERRPSSGTARAVFFGLDELDSPELADYAAHGFHLVLLTALHRVAGDPQRLAARVAAVPHRVIVCPCPHPPGRPVCWCTRPMPGFPLLLASRLDLDLTACVVLGGTAADRRLAAVLGAQSRV